MQLALVLDCAEPPHKLSTEISNRPAITLKTSSRTSSRISLIYVTVIYNSSGSDYKRGKAFYTCHGPIKLMVSSRCPFHHAYSGSNRGRAAGICCLGTIAIVSRCHCKHTVCSEIDVEDSGSVH